ncbi:MAG: S8 family serine peptidase [candidate division WOR-3 bacterium]
MVLLKSNKHFIVLMVLFSVVLVRGQMICLKTYQFDPRNGEPIIANNLIAQEEDWNYYIIQFKGPILKEWKQELKNIGAQVIGYLPDYAYIVRMDKIQKQMINQKSFINWIGLWHPAYKIHPDLRVITGLQKVTIMVFDTEDLTEIAARINNTGARILDISEVVSKLIVAEIGANQVETIANIKGVYWIEPRPEIQLHNNNSTRIVQCGSVGDTTIWAKGIKGQGQILGTTDSGITTAHWAFYHSTYPITTWGSYPSHRKIVNYSRGGSSATFGDESSNYWHGSHTGCTVCGDDSYNGGTSIYDGIAKLAKLSFCDIGYSGGLSIWSDLNQLWDTSYAYGARVVSNSWGASTGGAYYSYDAQADQFMWRRKTCLLVISAGNSGSGANTTGSPGNAKNALTIGAVGRVSPTTIASYSSRGPTDDNRYKPTVMAPGGLNTTGDPGLYSASGGTSGSSSSYWQMSGTSMASPSACGAVGLIREYLNRGFYPTGSEVPGNAIANPSAALLKAMAVISADNNISGYTVPNYNIGWGRIDLDSVLYFTGESKKLLLHDSASGGLDTGDSVVYQWQVNSSSVPLRVTLCWTDSAGNTSAARAIVNNLDLRVRSPSGTYYWGNVYSGGQSATGGSRDTLNVEENFRLNSPATGVWTAWVVGRNVPTGARQPYALVITGDVSNLQIGIAENTGPSEIKVKNLFNTSILTHNCVDYALNLNKSGKVEIKIYNILGACVYTNEKFYTKGEHRESISMAKMPQGIYYLFFNLPDGIKKQKIVLVK